MGNSGTRAAGQAKGAAQDAAHSEWARKLVLLGWAAQGVVYVALAWIVLQMAFGSAPEQASATGALELIAGSGAGKVALVVLGIGLFAFAIGRVLEVTILALPSVETKDKVVGFVLAFTSATLAVTALTIAGTAGSASSGGGSGGGSSQQGTTFVFGLPGGQYLVGLIGLVVAGLGAYTIYKGVENKFLNTLRTGEMSSTVRTWAVRIGTAAYLAKGVILFLFAWFLIQAALSYDPNEAATGLDGALRKVADASWGPALLAAIAVGLLAYGLFCGLESRYRRIGATATGTA